MQTILIRVWPHEIPEAEQWVAAHRGSLRSGWRVRPHPTMYAFFREANVMLPKESVEMARGLYPYPPFPSQLAGRTRTPRLLA